MTPDQLRGVRAPFDVVESRSGDRAVVKGFHRTDQNGNRVASAYFTTGGCIPLGDLLRYYDVVPSSQQSANAPKVRRPADPSARAVRI